MSETPVRPVFDYDIYGEPGPASAQQAAVDEAMSIVVGGSRAAALAPAPEPASAVAAVAAARRQSAWDAIREVSLEMSEQGVTGMPAYQSIFRHERSLKSLWSLKGSKKFLSDTALDTLLDRERDLEVLPFARMMPGDPDKCNGPKEIYRGKRAVSRTE